MEPITIDLSSEKVFESNELNIDKKVTFIYGKNGTGKSTLCKAINCLSSTYDVSIFDGFNNIIDKNERLNAVVLGEENTVINTQIEQKNSEIKLIQEEIDKIEKTLSPPEKDSETNFYTKKTIAEQNFNNQNKKLERFYVESARKIKEKNNPQVAATSYNKKNFQDDLHKANILNRDELEEYIDTLKSEVKIAPDIAFPKINLKDVLNGVNVLLEKKVAERVKVSRIENNPEKRAFAERGFNIHKRGDVCAFCGNPISDYTFDELDSYFSADEINQFRAELKAEIDKLQNIEKKFTDIAISVNDFYPAYKQLAENIKSKFEIGKRDSIDFIQALEKALDDKQKYLFEEREAVQKELPDNLINIESEYDSLKIKNNENDIEARKAKAREKIRCHYVEELANSFNYQSEISNLNTLSAIKDSADANFKAEQDKIDGKGGLQEQISRLQKEITDLQNQTKSESKLADNINEKLKHMVSFKLKHHENANANGYYLVKSLDTGEIRNIIDLSTGEKNIIAFLYFIEKLNEVKTEPSTKPMIIVFDDPMNSNDDGMQYLIMEELKKLIKNLKDSDHFVLLTHNKHFYINVTYDPNRRQKYTKCKYIHFISDGHKTKIKEINSENEDFKTSYEELWNELKTLFSLETIPAAMLLNPIRRIIETFTKFNGIKQADFCDMVPGAKKLFDVNSHSIDDLEAELNGKSKQQIIQLMYDCFHKNNYQSHFKSYWSELEVDDNGKLQFESVN